MWPIFALLSASFASLRRANEKSLSVSLHHFTIGWVVHLAALPVLLLALLFFGVYINPFTLGWSFWLPTVGVLLGFYPLNTFFYIKAMKSGELSKIVPLQSLGPVLALLLSWLLIGQRPSVVAAICIIAVMCGIYILNLRGGVFHNPLTLFSRDKPTLYTLGSLVLVAITGVLDTLAISASEPIYYSFVSTVGGVVVLFAVSRRKGFKDRINIYQHRKKFVLAGSLSGLSYLFYILALTSGPVAYITAVRGSANIVFGSLIGYLVFKEPSTPNKVLGLAIVTAASIALVAL